MALSTVIFVGESKEWLPEIVEKARKLKCGPGLDAATEVRNSELCCSFARWFNGLLVLKTSLLTSWALSVSFHHCVVRFSDYLSRLVL